VRRGGGVDPFDCFIVLFEEGASVASTQLCFFIALFFFLLCFWSCFSFLSADWGGQARLLYQISLFFPVLLFECYVLVSTKSFS